MHQLWPHQERGIQEAIQAIETPGGPICVTAPTGAGKSVMMVELVKWAAEKGWPVVLYTNRRLLREQLSGVLDQHGLEHGVRAAGQQPRLLEEVQVSSVQTERSRVYRTGKWALHLARLVLVDELHLFTNGTALQIIVDHCAAGATVVGFTATPLGLGGVCDRLIVAGTNSELRICGALVPAVTYAPDEPDLRHIGPIRVGEDLSESQQVKAMMRPGIFGRILTEFNQPFGF